MSGFGNYDPVEQMKLEEKKAAVDLDELQKKARDWLEKVTREKFEKLGLKGANILPLELYPGSSHLSQTCKPVPEIAIKTSLMKKLIADMQFTMYLCGGIGLSANQVGLRQRLFVGDWSEDRESPAAFINPEIVWKSDEVVREKEACLSMPGVKLHVVRPVRIKATWLDERGKRLDAELEGWAARVFLHELDHLDGKMMIDHPSTNRVERRLALKVGGRIARGELAGKPKPKRKKKRRR